MTPRDPEETDSPGQPIDALRVGWFILCVVGAVVPQAFPVPVLAAVLLGGLLLLLHEKELRYPSLGVGAAMRRYREEHSWSALWICVIGCGWLAGWAAVGDGHPRGVFVVCLNSYYLLWLATPVPQGRPAPRDDEPTP